MQYVEAAAGDRLTPGARVLPGPAVGHVILWTSEIVAVKYLSLYFKIVQSFFCGIKLNLQQVAVSFRLPWSNHMPYITGHMYQKYKKQHTTRIQNLKQLNAQITITKKSYNTVIKRE